MTAEAADSTSFSSGLELQNELELELLSGQQVKMDWDDGGSSNKKLKIGVAIGGGLLVIGAITACAIVLSGDDSTDSLPDTGTGQAPGTGSDNPISFDEYLNGAFSAKTFNGSWWDDTHIQWEDDEGNLVLWDVETDTTSILISKDQLESFTGRARFKGFAPNNKDLLLFQHDIDPVWRHSSKSRYTVLDSATGREYPVRPDDNKLSIAEWLPHPTEDRLVYVLDNNVYIRNAVTVGGTDFQVSYDGEDVTIYNGIPDWVYEEEILSTNKAMYYSPDGTLIAYAHFDDTMVQEFSWQVYGDPDDPRGHKYPTRVPIQYPKAGEDNPTVEIRVHNTQTKKTAVVSPPAEVADFDYGAEYLYSAASFITNTELSVIWMNRIQNHAISSVCREESEQAWTCETVDELLETKGWLDLFQPPFYNKNGDQYLQIQTNTDVLVTENHYRHLAKRTKLGSTLHTQFLTSGTYVVTSILGWNELTGVIYFMATEHDSPGERHLWTVEDDGNTPVCITCSLTMPSTGEACLYNSISLSPSFEYFVQTCLGPDVPEVVVRRMNTMAITKNLEDNSALKADLVRVDVPQRLYDEYVLPSGFTAKVRMLLPINYNPSGSTKYSTVVDVYGGPESQDVTYRWGIGWGDYLVTNHDVVYVSIDGRGTAYQSNEMMFAVYKNLGSAEIEDQILVTKHLSDKYPFIDSARRGIWGWSYGGYATAMTLIQDTEGVFACGISVAPPTSWYFYDTVYTERYMATPFVNDNVAGYNTSSILDKVEALRGKKFLLNHGNADDNVHYQNSMMFVKALESKDIQFEQRSLPDENHGIRGQSRFLYHGFDNFWGDCFSYEVKIDPPS